MLEVLSSQALFWKLREQTFGKKIPSNWFHEKKVLQHIHDHIICEVINDLFDRFILPKNWFGKQSFPGKKVHRGRNSQFKQNDHKISFHRTISFITHSTVLTSLLEDFLCNLWMVFRGIDYLGLEQFRVLNS